MAEGKFYWLKLKRDFFKRHDIQIIESMPNGKEYVLFYLKLLVESIDHEGELRFSETIPYNVDMLATITNTNRDTVWSALKVFSEFGMIEVLEDKTVFMVEVHKMLGSAADNDAANRKRRQREREKEQALLTCDTSVTKCHESKSKRESKSIEKEIKSTRFAPPTIEEISAYITENGYHVDASSFYDFYVSVGWKVGSNKPMKDWKAAIRTWERRDNKKPAKVKTAPSASMSHNYTAEQMAELRKRAKE